MIDRRKRRLDSFDHGERGGRRARDHHHLDAKQAGRLDLRIGGAAAVLRDDDVDMVLSQQGALAFQRERAAIKHIVGIDKRRRRIDGIDATDEIEMLRRRFGVMRALPARRQEDMARGGAERCDGSRNALHILPSIARLTVPFGAPQSDRSDRGGFGSDGGVGGNSFGERVRGVDQKIISTGLQKIGERHSTAETADTNRNRLSSRFFGAAGQRQENIAIITRRERFGDQARFAGAAENEDAGSSHV